MEKFSLTDIKKMNFSDVYRFLYKTPQSSKQAIATSLHMSLPTVSQHLNALTAEGLIEKCGQLESQIGRKAAAYSIVAQAKVSFGIEILEDHASMIVLDLYGEPVGACNFADPFANADFYFEKLCHEILTFADTLALAPDQILGAGFSLQGLVSGDGTEVIYGKILDCTGLCIDVIQKRLPFPCRFIHDSECAAYSDLWTNPQIDNALYLSLGYHLGGAVILDGKIASGRTGRTGTFEHMTLVPDGIPCYCGHKGCMECYCSVQALLDKNESLEQFFQEKEKNDPIVLKRWNHFLQNLAMAINNLHMVIDSDIILGGHLAPYLTEEDILALHRYVQAQTAFPEEESFILPGQRRKHAISIGAALPFIQEYLDNI